MPTEIFLKNYKPFPFDLKAVELDFDLDFKATKVKSRLHFERKVAGEPLVLNGEAVKLLSIALDGEPFLGYELRNNLLTITEVPDKFELSIEVEINPQNNKTLMGLYVSRGNYCTQCESHGFRRITFFPDRPDVMTRFTVSIVGDQSIFPYLLSNGNLIEERTLGNGRHLVKWHDPSLKPCYLFALVAGDFDLIEDSFVTMRGRDVALKLFLEKGFREQGHYAMGALKRAMKWDEDVYHREYDLDVFMTVAVSDFNFGAMENKGLNIFNTKYILANPQTATDADYQAIEGVVGHEYFHNWSGDRVTCRDWFQITLKEGLTVFRDQSFTADMTSQAVERIDAVNIIRNVQFLEDAGPMAHPIQPQSYIEINNFYTVTVYNKGAEIIRMIQTLLGKETFTEAMDLYFERHDGQAVTTEDFLRCMEDASGKDLTQFRRWYVQAGTPELTVTDHYDAEREVYQLIVKQFTPSTADGSPKRSFHIPLALGLLGANGRELPLQLESDRVCQASTMVLDVTDDAQTFSFLGVKEKPVPSLLRHFSAPVKLQYAYTDAQLAWLMQHDTDAFNRWDAGQTLARRIMLVLVEQYQQGQPLMLNKMLVNAFAAVLAEEQDLALAALSISLPTENYLMQFVNDIDAVHAVRQFVRRELATALKADFLAMYERLNDPKPYKYCVHDVAARRLKNCCLQYILCLPKGIDLAYAQFNQANNMTDQLGALLALNHTDCMERDATIVSFYEQFSDEPLVVNKWLQLQSSSQLPVTLNKVRALLGHPAYDAKNPNNVRALVGGFAANLPVFHAGHEGYEFLADQVIATDKFNGMLAARLVAPLIRFKQFDEKRQALMREQLERILATEGLTNDVYEVVAKALA